jgi:hypothetical protein
MDALNNLDSALRVTEITVDELRSLAEKREKELIALRDFSALERELSLNDKAPKIPGITKEGLDALELSRNAVFSELDEAQRLLTTSNNEKMDLQLQIQLLESALENSTADRNRMELALKEHEYERERISQTPSSSSPSSSSSSSSVPRERANQDQETSISPERVKAVDCASVLEELEQGQEQKQKEMDLLKSEVSELKLELAKARRQFTREPKQNAQQQQQQQHAPVGVAEDSASNFRMAREDKGSKTVGIGVKSNDVIDKSECGTAEESQKRKSSEIENQGGNGNSSTTRIPSSKDLITQVTRDVLILGI